MARLPARVRRDLAGRSERKLRIAILSPVWFPVPPTGYGGIEAVVSLLTEELVDRGHDVTLFASGDSRSRAKVVSVFPSAPSERIGESLAELRHALACFERASEFDIICDHSGPPAAALAATAAIPVVHTVHGPLDNEAGLIYRQIGNLSKNVGLISLSLNQRRPAPELPWVGNCPNAIELSRYPLSRTRGEYLAFIGRMSPDKGAHRAIEVAKQAGLPLKIAAKNREPKEQEYFERYVHPHLGEGIEYLGEVGHEAKVRLLQGARATVFPIDWEEPFGLVMIESLACGTPVIATNRGSVPEVLTNGRTGVIVADYRQIAAAIPAADKIDPRDCRTHVERWFSPQRMVESYLSVFRGVLAEHHALSATGNVATVPREQQWASPEISAGDQLLSRDDLAAAS